MTRFILNHTASFRQTTLNRVDVGLWTVGAETLVLATNMNYTKITISLADLGLRSSHTTQVLDSGAAISDNQRGFTFDSVGSGAFVIKK